MNYPARNCVFAFLILGLLSTSKSISQNNETAKRPNIILILTDDQRWDMLGCAGNKIIQTPFVDSLAMKGVRFTHAMVTTPICAASRASIITGLYERTHNFTFNRPALRKAYTNSSYPYLLKQSGYETGFVGKLGVDLEDSVDSLFSWSRQSGFPYWKELNGKAKHLTDIQGDQAIEFINQSVSDKPFCLSLSFSAPHADDDSKEQYFSASPFDTMYQHAVMPIPTTANPAFYEALPDFLKNTMSRERWYWRFDTPDKFQEMVKGYYRMISQVDYTIGRIQAELSRLGLADNTVIIFMGDNGYFLGDRGYADKWLMHDLSIRVPLIVYDPRRTTKGGLIIDDMVLNIDVTSTIIELAGIQLPSQLQGRSLLKIINDLHSPKLRESFSEHLMDELRIPNSECIRTSKWKFIRYPKHPEYIELYNLVIDPDEIHNLAYEEKYRAQVQYYNRQCDKKIKTLTADRIQ